MDVAPKGVNIRAATRDDVPAIVDWMMAVPLWQRYGIEREPTERNLTEAIERGDLVLTADAEESAIGLAWCLPNGMLGRYPYIRLLGVNPQIQSKGIGSGLLTAVEEEIVESGSRHLFLLVSDFNLDAQRFYERHGFVRSGLLPDLVIPGISEILYHKRFDDLSY